MAVCNCRFDVVMDDDGSVLRRGCTQEEVYGISKSLEIL